MTYYNEFRFEDGRTLLVDEDGNESDFCEELKIVKVLTEMATGDLYVGVKVRQADRSWKYRELLRSVVVSDPITALSVIGLSVAPVREYAITITEILMETEQGAFRESCHSALGFRNTKKGQVFLAREVMGRSETKSRSIDAKKLRPHGRFEAWRDGIADFVEDRVELQLALAIGASAPLAAILKRCGVIDGAATYALIGGSSTGKSVSLKMMASIWGKPTISDGIIDSFVSTEAYFFSELGRKNGFPHFVDETSAQPDVDLTRMVYNASLGKERGRCKSDGTPRPQKAWSGSVIFTGESSLFQQTNGNRGLYARVLEFSLPWTADAESAEALEAFVAKNYGTAAEPLVSYIMSATDAQLEELFNLTLENITERFKPGNGVERRVMKLYAVLIVTAMLMEDAWEMPLDIEGIIDLLHSHHEGNAEVKDRVSVVYDVIKQQILANQAKFPEEVRTFDVTSVWGEQGYHDNWPCVWIADDHLREFLKTAGENNMKTALGSLHEKGWIAKFGDRYKKTRKLGNVPVECYCVLLNQAGNPSAKKTKNRDWRKRSKIANLTIEEDE